MSHAEIRAWVQAHADELPRTLDELSQYPIAFRKVIVNSVSPERRTQFWREHLESFLGPSSTLTADQQAFVRDALIELPLIFQAPRADDLVRMTRLEGRIRQLFSRQQSYEMFGTVGPPEPPEGLPLPRGAQTSAR